MLKPYNPPPSPPPPGVPLDQTEAAINYGGSLPPKWRRTRDEWTRMERLWDWLTRPFRD